MNESLKFQRQKMNEFALEQLMDWIIDGKLTMGQKLNAEKISQDLGISRMPVREALSSLEIMGLVEAVPYVGFKVIEMDDDSLNELYLIRMSLEPIAAYNACKHITSDDIARIKRFEEQLEQIFEQEKQDPKQIFLLNRDFHFAIYQCSHMRHLCEIIKYVWNHMSFYKLVFGRTYLKDEEAARGMINDHREFISCLEKRDPDGLKEIVAQALSGRIKEVQNNFSSILKK